MELIFLPSLLFTHSLLMKRPVGWVYFVPLGAVSSTWRSDMAVDALNGLCNLGWRGFGGVRIASLWGAVLVRSRVYWLKRDDRSSDGKGRSRLDI
jgi:hypothetical protein